VALEPSGDGFEIRLDDRGPGLPAAVRERLFEPFASGQPGGAGLGLALARRIVLLHEGELAVGDRPGGGTRVRLWLPAGEIAT
jgi:signal transduction histidine kinase